MKVTMETIAKKVGVSRNAVSLALRNHPSISQATREKILAAAAELGYQRNPAYGELMSQMRLKGHGSTQATLALFNANKNPMAFAEHPTIPLYVEGCRRRAGELGYPLDTFWLHQPNTDSKRWIDILETRGIRGIVLIGFMTQNRIPEHLLPLVEHFPTVVTGVRTMVISTRIWRPGRRTATRPRKGSAPRCRGFGVPGCSRSSCRTGTSPSTAPSSDPTSPRMPSVSTVVEVRCGF